MRKTHTPIGTVLLVALFVAMALAAQYENAMTASRFPLGTPPASGRGCELLEDIDGNGLFDFFSIGMDVSTAQRTFRLQNKTGEFYNALTSDYFPHGGPLPEIYCAVKAADLNGDGRKDIVLFGSLGSGQVTQVFLQQENGSFTNGNTPSLFPEGILPNLRSGDLIIDDFNGDGHSDILAIGYDGTRSIHLRMNNGNGTFRNPSLATLFPSGSPPGLWYTCMTYADLDGDGQKDFLISGTATGGNYFGAFRQSPIGEYRPFSTSVLPVTEEMSVSFCSRGVGDINGDGHPDMIQVGRVGTGGAHQTTIRVMNATSGSFVDGHSSDYFTVVPLEASIGPIFVRDINGDGRDDVFFNGDSDVGRLLYIFLQNEDGMQVESLTSMSYPTGGGWQAATSAMGAITPPDQPPTISLAGYVSSYTRFLLTMECPSNTTSVGPRCLSCSVGQYTDWTAYECADCDSSSYSTNGTASECTPCPEGEVSNEDRTGCVVAEASPAAPLSVAFLNLF